MMYTYPASCVLPCRMLALFVILVACGWPLSSSFMVHPARIRGLAIPQLPRPTSVGRPVLSTPLSGTGDLSRGDEVEQLLDEVDELQYQAFREVGVLGQPLPDPILKHLKAEGRLGTEGEREALMRAVEVTDDGSRDKMLEALRFRAMSKRARAEADVAAMQLANDKVPPQAREKLEGGLEVADLLIGAQGASTTELQDVKKLFDRVLSLPSAKTSPSPPPSSE